MHVAVIDIGSPAKGNLGWWIQKLGKPSGKGGTNVDECIAAVGRALKVGPVALGFEAPMFVPMRNSPKDLTKPRNGECENGVNRPFSAGPGASVLVTGLTVVPYVLARLREQARGKARMAWRKPLKQPGQLLLFEAFVTNQKRKDKTRHVDDARAATHAFFRKLPLANCRSDVESDAKDFNLLGAAMLRAGWTDSIQMLCEPCLVVKACEPKRRTKRIAITQRVKSVRLHG